MKIVLFLGAGFSRVFGLPLMREFFEHAKSSIYVSDSDKDFLRDLQLRARRGLNMLTMDDNELEDILSFYLACENFTGRYPEDTSEDFGRLCLILAKLYGHVSYKGRDKYWNLPVDPMRMLLGESKERKSGNKLSIITTNYDITLEYMLWRLGLRCYVPFEWEPIMVDLEYKSQSESMYDSAEYETNVLICKLHGSINWFSHPKNRNSLNVMNKLYRGEIDEDLDDEDDLSSPDFNFKTVWYPEISDDSYKHDQVPFIVPPTIFKLQPDRRIQAIWDAAGMALQKADKLIFVGYSFPESDLYIRYFLAANLYENVDLGAIHIIAPSASNTLDKLKKIMGVNFGNRLKALDVKWETCGYSVLDEI